MTNLDLPPISLARYVELLKRRKWQVVPVSLLGMLVGALIALAVPRYYVATTEVRFNAEHLLTDQMRQFSDPLESLLADAYHLVPLRVPEVLKQLGWQEALVDDDDARAQFVSEVTRRVEVADVGTGPRRNRSNTVLRISYRDTDGRRAADFANALRETWMKAQLEEALAINREERRQVQERQNALQESVEALEREVRSYEAKHKLDPSVRDANLLVVSSTISAQQREDERERARAQMELDEVQVQIDELRQTLEGRIVPERVPAPPPPIDTALALELQALELEILRARKTAKIFMPGTSYRQSYEQKVAELEEQKKAKTPVPATAYVPNPEYLALNEKLGQLQGRSTALAQRIATLTKLIDKTEQEIAARPGIVQGYRQRTEALAAEYGKLHAVESELDRVTALARRIEASKPYSMLSEARVPRRPTEPNVTILALMGSLVGLGVAIGLIFAFDALRFTYKTLEDLERGLAVPVLGGVSHVETVEERSQVRRGRWIVSVLAIALLFLIVAVATFYYVAPARLPTWARDVLDMMLGGGE